MFILGEGWKEFKAGTISEVAEDQVLNPQTLEDELQARARHTSYVAALGEPETIGALLWQAAVRRGWQQAFVTEVVADTAAWIWNLATYFDKHKHRMQYLEWRNDGWLIGSGTMESVAKQYKHRFTAAGMRWKRDGLECLIPVRSAVLSGTFSARWHSPYYAPRN